MRVKLCCHHLKTVENYTNLRCDVTDDYISPNATLNCFLRYFEKKTNFCFFYVCHTIGHYATLKDRNGSCCVQDKVSLLY